MSDERLHGDVAQVTTLASIESNVHFLRFAQVSSKFVVDAEYSERSSGLPQDRVSRGIQVCGECVKFSLAIDHKLVSCTESWYFQATLITLFCKTFLPEQKSVPKSNRVRFAAESIQHGWCALKFRFN